MRSAEIGNKQLVRAFGDVLDIVDVKQYPGRLSTEPMQMVVPISLIPYKLKTASKTIALGGLLNPGVVIMSSDPAQDDPIPQIININEIRMVGGLSFNFAFAVGPTSGDRVGIKIVSHDWKNSGNNVVWWGTPETIGWPLDNDHLNYSIGMNASGAQGSSDRRATSMAMPMQGWIPANLELSVTFFMIDTTTSANKVFPACDMNFQLNYVESPVGIIPPL